MPVTTSIKSYKEGTVPKQGVPMIICYCHKSQKENKWLVSDSSGTATLVADKDNHMQVIKAKVLYIIIMHKIFN